MPAILSLFVLLHGGRLSRPCFARTVRGSLRSFHSGLRSSGLRSTRLTAYGLRPQRLSLPNDPNGPEAQFGSIGRRERSIGLRPFATPSRPSAAFPSLGGDLRSKISYLDRRERLIGPFRLGSATQDWGPNPNPSLQTVRGEGPPQPPHPKGGFANQPPADQAFRRLHFELQNLTKRELCCAQQDGPSALSGLTPIRLRRIMVFAAFGPHAFRLGQNGLRPFCPTPLGV